MKTVAPIVQAAGDGSPKEVVARIFVAPSDDADTVRGMGRFAIAAYLNVPVYAAFHEWLGRGEILAEMWRLWKEGDRKAALAAIPDQVVDDLIVWGPPEKCREHVQRYVDNGVTTPALAILPFGIDTRQAIRDLAPADDHRYRAPVRWGVGAVAAVAAIGLSMASSSVATAGPTGAPPCAPGGANVVITGVVDSDDAKTYRVLPFEVMPGTTRVEVGYEWADDPPPPGTPVDSFVETVLDLGLWDEGGVGSPDGFRGWSGSRQGRVADGQDPIWVQADSAERGYRPDPVQPGTWHVDLGIATASPQGAAYTVTVRCLAAPVGAPFFDKPVDAYHIASDEPGWYHGDFHMHGRHSNPNAPSWDEFVQFARVRGPRLLPGHGLRDQPAPP